MLFIDALLTAGQAHDLVEWIAGHGKNLTTVYITHGHGDHWFGLGAVLDRFPDAQAFALPAAIEQMRVGTTPEFLESFWRPRFDGKLPRALVLPEPLEGHTIGLEGHELVVVELGHTDTDQTSCLHVPDLGLVVAGDAAYNDVHLYLAESDPEKRRDWIAALDTIESLHPRSVIAGHQRAGRTTAPRSSRRPANTSATSTASRRQPARLRISTPRSSRCIPNASIRTHCGSRLGE